MNHKKVSRAKRVVANLQNLTGGTRSAKYGGRAAKKARTSKSGKEAVSTKERAKRARGKRRPALPKYNKKKK